jgi:hypothetical protein
MVRASQAYRICTNRITFDGQEFDRQEQAFSAKVLSKTGNPYYRGNLFIYLDTHGLKTDAKAFQKILKERETFLKDELPQGAKSYLHEIWLEKHHGFRDYLTSSDDIIATSKGIYSEEAAIELLGEYYGRDFEKNAERKFKGFLTGEADIIDEQEVIVFPDDKVLAREVRDVKVPVGWKSFRSKTSIPESYRWQLVSYCYLYDAVQAHIDYVLMPTPYEVKVRLMETLPTRHLQNLNDTDNAIMSLEPQQRIKSFSYTGDLKSDIEFLKKRLDKAEKYYNSLTYETCMNFIEE